MFWSIALFLGDGAYQIVKMAIISYTHWLMQRRGANIGEPSLEDEKVPCPVGLIPPALSLLVMRPQTTSSLRDAARPFVPALGLPPAVLHHIIC